MSVQIDVLDQGYVRLIDSWGSDSSIIEAARMSTGKGFQGWDEDHKLLAYLYRHKHMTPFEMCGLTIEVKAPIFVFREWHRHRVPFSYNEMSARYVPLPNENYLPSLDDLIKRSADAATTSNRQASGTRPCNAHDAQIFISALKDLYAQAQTVYQFGLDVGIPKELARLPMPVARYSRMRASANTRGWLAFLTLRMAPNAQWEIRQYANAVAALVEQVFPRTWGLFINDFTRREEA